MKYVLRTYSFLVPVLLLAWQSGAKEVVSVITRTDHEPVIDGFLNDSTWLNLEPITGFMQYSPVEGIPPSESTYMYIAYDEDNFYLAFKCYDSEIGEVRATMAQREQIDNDDVIGFAFDTYNSEREAFLFNINPYGIPSDFISHFDGFIDYGWDADLRCKGKVLSDCYCIEAAVPFKSLRMPAKDEQEWGFYALRVIKRKGELDVWPPRTRKIPSLVAQASLLKGIKGVESGRNFSLLPYVFSSYINRPGEEDRSFDLGLDVRYGITSSVMVDATVNPDYSQIEADPDEIELSERYDIQLPEKRPFFTEGTNVFASNQLLVYSRVIGNPVAGLKLTGKIGRNRIGVVSVADDESYSGKRNYYNFLRVKADVFTESTIGLLMTNKDDPEGATYNRTLSMDGFFRFMDMYSLKSQVTRTLTKDSTSSFEATGYNLNLERLGTNSYNSIWYNDFPEEFQAQGGYMWNVVGYREVGTYNNLSFRKPHELINEFELNGSISGRFDFDNELREEYFSAAAEMSLDRVWTKLGFRKNHEYVNGQDFRYSDFRYELWNTPRRYLEHYFSLMWGDAPHYIEGFTGWRYRLIYNATLKPVSRAVFNMNISSEDFYYKYRGSRCYLQTVAWTKLSYQIVPDMFVRGIYQYNNLYKISDVSLLFAFEYRPLSNIYVGTNLYDFSKAEQMDDNLEAFVKLGYLWRL